MTRIILLKVQTTNIVTTISQTTRFKSLKNTKKTVFLQHFNGTWTLPLKQVLQVIYVLIESNLFFSFNMICLPEHNSFAEFEKALLTAITEGSEGFGFA